MKTKDRHQLTLVHRTLMFYGNKQCLPSTAGNNVNSQHIPLSHTHTFSASIFICLDGDTSLSSTLLLVFWFSFKLMDRSEDDGPLRRYCTFCANFSCWPSKAYSLLLTPDVSCKLADKEVGGPSTRFLCCKAGSQLIPTAQQTA